MRDGLVLPLWPDQLIASQPAHREVDRPAGKARHVYHPVVRR
jgi:hypothetical protein